MTKILAQRASKTDQGSRDRLLHTAVWALLAGCVVAIPWLARHNQSIFGTLYVIGCAYLVAMYLSARSG